MRAQVPSGSLVQYGQWVRAVNKSSFAIAKMRRFSLGKTDDRRYNKWINRLIYWDNIKYKTYPFNHQRVALP